MSEPALSPGLTFRVDPWASEYASALQQEEEDADEPGAEVDLYVEASPWAPIAPRRGPAPPSIVFVDGVQRIEVRVLAMKEGVLTYGAFATVAVGAVRAGRDSALIERADVRRVLGLAGDVSVEPVEVSWGGKEPLRFAPHCSQKNGYLGVADAVGEGRRDLEMALGQAMVEAGHPLVVMDGRLRLFPSTPVAMVGYAKTMHRSYLPAPEARVLPELRMGQRCPLFLIKEQRELYSWYLRLAPTRPIDHPLAGLVRLETHASIGLGQAVSLADQTAVHLPRFASTPERDPRAPQNLLPIGGLETRLRHEMGDHAWIRRAIETYLHQMAR